MSSELQKALDAVLGRRRRKRPSSAYLAVKDGELVNPVPLDEFLEGVGSLLRLPPRALPAPPPAGAATAEPARRRSWRLAALVLVPVAVVLLWPSQPAPESSESLPPLLTGTWITSDPRYANRSMTIAPEALVFKNGDRADDQSAHPIQQVRTAMRGDTTLVTMTYAEAEGLFDLSLKFVPRPRPAIILVHQEEMTWYRTAPGR